MIRSTCTSKARLAAIVFLICVASVVQATDREPARRQVGPVNPLAGATVDDLSSQRMMLAALSLTGEVPLYAANTESPDPGVYAYDTKSPKRAFLQSALIPGWGQWYNGSRIKPFFFLGIEAAGWIGVSHFNSSGNQKQGKYQRFADQRFPGPDSLRWDYNRYIQGLQAVYHVNSDTVKYPNPEWPACQDCPDSLPWSHHVSVDANGNPIKNQAFYENVGKYDQFAFGWRDYNDADGDGIGTRPTKPEDTVGADSQNRRNYLDQRAGANREFSRASTILILTIGNHLISAFEAAIGASRHNKALDQFGSVDAHMYLARSPVTGNLAPKLTLSYRF